MSDSIGIQNVPRLTHEFIVKLKICELFCCVFGLTIDGHDSLSVGRIRRVVIDCEVVVQVETRD
jgi:hypothetical protein